MRMDEKGGVRKKCVHLSEWSNWRRAPWGRVGWCGHCGSCFLWLCSSCFPPSLIWWHVPFAVGSDAPHWYFRWAQLDGSAFPCRGIHIKYMKKLHPVYSILYVSWNLLIEVSDFKLDLFKLLLNTLVSALRAHESNFWIHRVLWILAQKHCLN